MGAIPRPFPRCSWCNRVLTAIAETGAKHYEKPHCPSSSTCNWGLDCHAERVKGAAA